MCQTDEEGNPDTTGEYILKTEDPNGIFNPHDNLFINEFKDFSSGPEQGTRAFPKNLQELEEEGKKNNIYQNLKKNFSSENSSILMNDPQSFIAGLKQSDLTEVANQLMQDTEAEQRNKELEAQA